MSLIQRQTIVAGLRALPAGRPAVEFLDYLTVEAGLSENTILAYGRDLREFLIYCRDNGLREIGGLEVHRVQLYLGVQARRDASENSAKRALVAIRMFLRFAKLRGLIEDDGSEILESPKVWQRLPTVCNKQQVLKLLEAPCPEERSTCGTGPCSRSFTPPACGPARPRDSRPPT